MPGYELLTIYLKKMRLENIMDEILFTIIQQGDIKY